MVWVRCAEACCRLCSIAFLFNFLAHPSIFPEFGLRSIHWVALFALFFCAAFFRAALSSAHVYVRTSFENNYRFDLPPGHAMKFTAAIVHPE